MELADVLAFHHHVAVARDLSFHRGVLSQPTHQNAGAPVDETLREPFVQGVRQPVL